VRGWWPALGGQLGDGALAHWSREEEHGEGEDAARARAGNNNMFLLNFPKRGLLQYMVLLIINAEQLLINC
jgi:hypothetical protein